MIWRTRVNGAYQTRGLAMLALSALISVPAFSQNPTAAAATKGTIGLVLTDWRYALDETPEKTECPAGLQKNEIAQFKAVPTHMQQLKKFGAVQNRGPNGENANYTPLAVEDPLPFSELKTKTGFGFNLDGTADGSATAKTCKHEKFTAPDNEPVDNQMARVMGCVMGWRKTGFMAEFYANEVKTSPVNRHLIEITGVDDESNDANVEVTIYKGQDRLVQTASGSFVPFMSQRIDDRFPQYILKTRGKIVDGVLTTDPIPLARLPLYQVQIAGERQIRDLRLRLKLTATGADGFLGGYENLNTWWNMHSKGPGVGTDIGSYSPAGLYRAAHRYADGYPDATTGECTAISVAYKVSAVRAIIVHAPKPQSSAVMTRN